MYSRTELFLESLKHVVIIILGAFILVYGFLWIYKRYSRSEKKREREERGSTFRHLDKAFKELKESQDRDKDKP